MKVNALVLSRNPRALRVLVAGFAELGVEYRVLLSASETIETLNTSLHSALVLDFDVPWVLEVVKMVRTLPRGRRPVLFAIPGKRQSIMAAFQAGANFVLHKPLDLLQVMHCFRIAGELPDDHGRGHSREEIETLGYFELPQGTVPALVCELTEQGLSVRAGEPLIPWRGVVFRFLLPGTTHVVHGTGDFIWSDNEGRGGLFFRHMPTACRRDLDFWLKRQHVRRSEFLRRLSEPVRNRWRALASPLH
jgi:CheY-like chemotaxis protein